MLKVKCLLQKKIISHNDANTEVTGKALKLEIMIRIPLSSPLRILFLDLRSPRVYKICKINPSSGVIQFATRALFLRRPERSRLRPPSPSLLKERERMRAGYNFLAGNYVRESARQRSASLTRDAIFHALLKPREINIHCRRRAVDIRRWC